MNGAAISGGPWLARVRRSPVGIVALLLFAMGLVLAATVHKGFMILLAVGAFGPAMLRQFGLLDDQDEFQKEAAAQAGLRAYLAGAVFLMLAVIWQGWDLLSVGSEQIPAFGVVTVMLVVYYASYCLSFWDVPKAVSRVLYAFGALWLGFIVLSHATEPVPLVLEGLTVAGPFLAGGALCRRWPRVVGVLLLAASVGAAVYFDMLPFGESNPEKVFQHVFMLTLIPLPLAIGGVALLAARRDAAEM